MDMNIVKVFVAIYEQESVSGAANILNITQPSVSYALKKMRDELNDELFVRQNTGMKPTRQAIEIYRTFSKALGEIDAVVASRKVFDYRTSRHKFVIAMSDLGEHYYLRHIFREITKLAPSVEIEILPLEITKLQEWLDKGFIDAAICNRTNLVHDVHCDILLKDRYVCLKGIEHARVKDTISMAQFLEEKHIVASSQTGHNFYKEWYAGKNRKLKTTLTVPDLNILAFLIESSDCISVVPETYIIQKEKYFAVTALPLPIDFPCIEVCLYSQKTIRIGKEKLWFLKMLKDICLHGSENEEQPTH
jgi:DNA-binding transcriptional LysR family regulator